MPVSEQPLAVGVVGGGLAAQAAHLPALKRLDGLFSIVGLADPSKRIRAVVGDRYGIPHRHADWRGLLEAPSLDAIAVCSPHGTHAEIVLAALSAGLHVLVEKPLSITVEDAEAICGCQEDTGLVVQVGYMKRFDRGYEALLRRLPQSSDGLRLVNVITCDPGMARVPFVQVQLVAPGPLPPVVARAMEEDVRRQVEAAVGRADDVTVQSFATTYLAALIHDVNLVHGLLDRMGVKTSRAAVASWHRQDGQAASLLVELPGEVIWQSAWLLLDRLERFSERVSLNFEDHIDWLDLPAPYLHGLQSFEEQWRHFHECVVKGVSCRTPPVQALRDIALLRDLYLADA